MIHFQLIIWYSSDSAFTAGVAVMQDNVFMCRGRPGPFVSEKAPRFFNRRSTPNQKLPSLSLCFCVCTHVELSPVRACAHQD